MNKAACTTPKKPSVKTFDSAFTDKDHIYAWDNDDLKVRADDLICPSCNHELPNTSDPKDWPNCTNAKCSNCGYSVKLYGYPDDLYYDNTVDDADYTDAPEYNYNNETPFPYPYEGDRWNMYKKCNALKKRNMMRKNNKRVTFAEEPEMIENNDEEMYEHMNTTHYTTMGVTTGVCCAIILLFIVYYIAYARGELHKPDGQHYNWSLIVCIFFFWQIYIGYVLVDWITAPNHGCIQ